MSTAAFRQAIQRLLGLARCHSIALMGRETRWRDCHRGLIGDYLHVSGVGVSHILDQDRHERHVLSKAAELRNGVLCYLLEDP